jgi:hypothetical protein
MPALTLVAAPPHAASPTGRPLLGPPSGATSVATEHLLNVARELTPATRHENTRGIEEEDDPCGKQAGEREHEKHPLESSEGIPGQFRNRIPRTQDRGG